jgi:uncharacterized delta-60 repeat protein
VYSINSYSSKLFLIIALSTLFVACGGGSSGESIADTTPDAFHFDDQINVGINTIITSNSITVTGIESTTSISVINGDYSIDGATFVNTSGTITNGQTIKVRHTSSAQFSSETTTVLNIGGIRGSFTSTTGPIGTGFNRAKGFNDSVISIVPAEDGSGDLYVIGHFTTYNSTASNHIIRLNSDGTVDEAFAVGTGFNASVYSISLAADGSGDVYLGGDFSTYNGTASNRVIRLNSDGTLDTAFAVGSGFDASVYNISSATDGSGDLYVGGSFNDYNGTTSNKIIRLNSDGTVDTSFIMGSGFDDIVYNISPTTDGSGNLYVGGSFSTYNDIASKNIIRLHSDGTVDSTFSVGSGFDVPDEFNVGIPDISYVKSIVFTTDGSGDLYAYGNFETYNGSAFNHIIRLNSDGTADAAFMEEADVIGGVCSVSAVLDDSGDMYLGLCFADHNILRLHSNGTVETEFEVGSGFSYSVNSISPATDGSGDLYVGGRFTTYNDTGSNHIIRLNNDGTVDTAFMVGSGFNSSVYSISPTTDGSYDLYVGGAFTTYNGTAGNTANNYLMRLSNDGTMDTTSAVESSFYGVVKSVITATDGSGDIYMGGDFPANQHPYSTAVTHIMRLNNDGTVDTSFGIEWSWNSAYQSGVQCFSAATDGSGDIYVGGGFNFSLPYSGPPLSNTTGTRNIMRLNSDGSIDTTFVGMHFDDDVYSISPTSDGSGDVYVGGKFTTFESVLNITHSSNNIIRLNSDGTVDTEFVVGSGFETVDATQPDWVDLYNSVYSISMASDASGDLYVGGDFNTYNGITSNHIIRLNSDGTVDTAFDIGSGFDEPVRSIISTSDGSGDLYVSGEFTTYNGIASNHIIRLSSDGTVNTSFAVGSGFNSTVNTLTLSTDGSGDLYVGGTFTSYQNSTVNKIARLNADGSLN